MIFLANIQLKLAKKFKNKLNFSDYIPRQSFSFSYVNNFWRKYMKLYIKIIMGLFLGAIAGYAYYFFIGCNSGTCPISSNPLISTAYGALVGLILSIPSKKKDEKKN